MFAIAVTSQGTGSKIAQHRGAALFTGEERKISASKK
jgi:hypothetical protein